MVAQEAKSGKFAYYVCGTLLKRGAGTCRALYLNAGKFEALVRLIRALSRKGRPSSGALSRRSWLTRRM